MVDLAEYFSIKSAELWLFECLFWNKRCH